jgi:hypothetical protein
LIGLLVLLPRPSQQQPLDPIAVEERLVEGGVRNLEPGTLIVLPSSPLGDSILVDFPDFLLPPTTSVTFADDPRVATHNGPRLLYLGLACISWDEKDGDADRSDLRPECRALRGNARPWAVHMLQPGDLPRLPDGSLWTFQQLGTGVPFGFFSPAVALNTM